MKKFYFIILSIFICISCQNQVKNDIEQLIKDWSNKEIIFSDSSIFLSGYDTLKINCNDNKLKIVTYTDPKGCIGCQLKLHEWKTLNQNILSLTNNNVLILKYISPKRQSEALFEIITSDYNYPTCIDINDSFNKLNHFPDKEQFRCFLLDENNRVILIGNPVQNPKIKDLYIRTICERLGIDTTNINIADNQNENRFSFGRFPFSDTMKTQFVLKNDSLVEMKIDTIFTSCECTTAKIDKSVIKKSDSAIVSVSFKTDKPEEFVREIYVKTNSKEKPIVYSVEGMAF
ncbi:MAG: DUF1573 domain-containing protein [Bacteroidales bacterium]|nr:DUF1573 domain-containing protein [Bacteroidales bacterium]